MSGSCRLFHLLRRLGRPEAGSKGPGSRQFGRNSYHSLAMSILTTKGILTFPSFLPSSMVVFPPVVLDFNSLPLSSRVTLATLGIGTLIFPSAGQSNTWQ